MAVANDHPVLPFELISECLPRGREMLTSSNIRNSAGGWENKPAVHQTFRDILSGFSIFDHICFFFNFLNVEMHLDLDSYFVAKQVLFNEQCSCFRPPGTFLHSSSQVGFSLLSKSWWLSRSVQCSVSAVHEGWGWVPGITDQEPFFELPRCYIVKVKI